jgi:hypothetical protein
MRGQTGGRRPLGSGALLASPRVAPGTDERSHGLDRPKQQSLEHDPEKHALGPRPDGWEPVFPRDKREAFARRSCSNKRIERDDDSKKSHPAPGAPPLRIKTRRLIPNRTT